MTTKELKQIIKEKFGWNEFEDLLINGEYEYGEEFKDKTGLDIIVLDKESTPYNGLAWRFRINGQTYQLDGEYNSWSDDNHEDIQSFYKVKLVEKTIQIYEKDDDDDDDPT